ncbi:MAG: hypothetical protein HQ494_07850 [Rhodospirillales bacterium]|nr:hypothetical protein [Rhodospirillales bacterium]
MKMSLIPVRTAGFGSPVGNSRNNNNTIRGPGGVAANPRMTGALRKDSAKGLCRRYAPQASALTTVWMETKSSDWCGDHVPINPAG